MLNNDIEQVIYYTVSKSQSVTLHVGILQTQHMTLLVKSITGCTTCSPDLAPLND